MQISLGRWFKSASPELAFFGLSTTNLRDLLCHIELRCFTGRLTGDGCDSSASIANVVVSDGVRREEPQLEGRAGAY